MYAIRSAFTEATFLNDINITFSQISPCVSHDFDLEKWQIFPRTDWEQNAGVGCKVKLMQDDSVLIYSFLEQWSLYKSVIEQMEELE